MAHAHDKETKRRALVTAAAKVFARQGFLPTRVADVALEAGVGKGTVYEYFSSKDELVFAVCENLQAEIGTRADAILAEGGSATKQFRRLMRFAAAITLEQAEFQSVVLDFWAASRGGALEKRFAEHSVASYRHYRELLATLVRRGQDAGEFRASANPEAIATLIVAAIDGLGVQLFFDRSIDPIATTERFTDTLLDGLLAAA